uniref:Uncharacterized protein n=1 Tax=Delphinium grandiflorum TaxID=85439 RepID=U6C4X9_DELGR|nr:hypothetical protein [Delphinium grandiflorum]
MSCLNLSCLIPHLTVSSPPPKVPSVGRRNKSNNPFLRSPSLNGPGCGIRCAVVGGNVKRSDFPPDFAFGAATSALQTEGAAKLYGKGPSTWDRYIQENPETIQDGGNIDITCDSYHRYKEDIAMLKYMGVTSYRFSIAWTRILPKGSLEGGINQQGIDHYKDVLNELELNGIEPFVTLHHFDTPQALEEKYGGFLSKYIVNDFKDYCDICFKNFGDKVKHWITINEPWLVAVHGYSEGSTAPGRCSAQRGCKEGNSATEPYLVAHNMILAHAAATQLYRKKYKAKQGGEIGITLIGFWHLPYSNSVQDLAAVARIRDFDLGWFMEPLVYGDYPVSMKDLVKDRLPAFSIDEKEMVVQSFDFIGINYYTTRFAKGLPLTTKEPPSRETDSRVLKTSVNARGESADVILEDVHSLHAAYPEGLRQVLIYLMHRYRNPKIYITENGNGNFSENSEEFRKGKRDDNYRIEYIRGHLNAVKRAREEGVDVRGYFVWSLMDSFEFSHGYSVRFGLWFVDYDNDIKRFTKRSANWYCSFLKK